MTTSHLSLSHSYDSEFTGVQSRSLRPPRRPRHSRAKPPASIHSAHVQPIFPTQQTELFPSSQAQSISHPRIHLLLSPRWRELAHTLPSAVPRHPPSWYFYTRCPRALHPILVETSFASVNRKGTSILHVQGARNLPSAEAPPPIKVLSKKICSTRPYMRHAIKTPCYRSRLMRKSPPSPQPSAPICGETRFASRVPLLYRR